jgi:hypothetical protein
MKRISITIMTLLLVLITANIFAQSGGQDSQGIVGLKMLETDTADVTDVIIIDGDLFDGTTQTSPADDTLATKAYVDAGGAAGVTILGFDKETGIANISTTEGVVDTALFEGRYGYLTTDTLIIRNDSLLLGNDIGVPRANVAIDSVTNEYDKTTGILSTYWYIGSTQYGPTVDTLDGRHVKYTDSTSVYYSQHYLDSALAVAGKKVVYTISLPINGTLSGSVGAAVEGVNYPAGWTLTASGENLTVQHNGGSGSASVNVSYNISGTEYKYLRPFEGAFSGWSDLDDNSLRLENVSAKRYTGFIVRIKIILE